MRKESSERGPALPDTGPAGEATRTSPRRQPASKPWPDDPAPVPVRAPADMGQPHSPTDVVKRGPEEPAAPATQASQVPEHPAPDGRPPGIVRYGPGVPATLSASQGQLTAERVWHPRPTANASRRPARLGALLGSVLTVILLAASGALLYLRLHHVPFRVIGVTITRQAHTGCGVDVTGRITMNGSAGTVSYQWVFGPARQALQPLSQPVAAGQRAAYVTVAVEGQGRGSAREMVTLQVLGPDPAADSTALAISC
jgi:hypothetical protein